MGIATAIGGIIRVDKMKNSKSSFNGTLKRENAYAAITPKPTDRNVEPKAMMSELTNRGTKLDLPATTMLSARATLSHLSVASGNVAMYSGVCRERVVNRLQKPCELGSKRILGG